MPGASPPQRNTRGDKPSLAETHPELAAQMVDPMVAWSVTRGSNARVEWWCDKGHPWNSIVRIRVSRGDGCAVCRGLQVHIGFNDLATTHPHIAAQAHNWDPTTLTAGSDEEVEWWCEKGHSWPAAVKTRTHGNGCGVCRGLRVEVGFNDLATTHPHIAAQAHNWDPTTLTAGSGKKVEWWCEKGHSWPAPPSERTRGQGCGVCHGARVQTGFNDLASLYPDLAAEADGWDPSAVTFGSTQRLPWKCTDCGWKWHATVGNRAGNDSGCPECSAGGGFKIGRPGWVYLLRHPERDLLQVGISNVITQRLNFHFKHGWELVDTIGPIDGQAAFNIEQSFLKALDKLGVARGKSVSEPFSGFTESWFKDQLPINDLSELRWITTESEWEI